MASALPRIVKDPSKVRSLSASFLSGLDAFIFDCDGVIWRASEVCDARIPATLKSLEVDHGKKVFFVTNNTQKSREQTLQKLNSLGINFPNLTSERIYTAGFAACEYIRMHCPHICGPAASKKVFMVGTKGLEEEMQLSGIPVMGGPSDTKFTAETVEFFKDITNPDAPGVLNWEKLKSVRADPDVGAVVCGMDPWLNYYKIHYAQLCLNRYKDETDSTTSTQATESQKTESQKGQDGQPHSQKQNPCKFIVTNPDAVGHMTPDQMWAGTGAILGAIKGCTGIDPIIAGKPSSLLIDLIAEKFGLERGRICMVGDRLDTDIIFGLQNGMKTVFVLSGVTNEEDMLQSDIRPDLYIDNVGSFLSVTTG